MHCDKYINVHLGPGIARLPMSKFLNLPFWTALKIQKYSYFQTLSIILDPKHNTCWQTIEPHIVLPHLWLIEPAPEIWTKAWRWFSGGSFEQSEQAVPSYHPKMELEVLRVRTMSRSKELVRYIPLPSSTTKVKPQQRWNVSIHHTLPFWSNVL